MSTGQQVEVVNAQTVFSGRVVAWDDDSVTVLVTGFAVLGKWFAYADDTVMKFKREYVAGEVGK
jgi:hypothetical protein